MQWMTLVIRFFVLTLSFFVNEATASETKTALEQSVERQRKATSVRKLKGKAVFVEREIAGTDIVHLEVNLPQGQANLPEDRRAISALTFETMPLGSTKIKKEELYKRLERYSISLRCNGGIEQSGCQVETTSDNMARALDILTSIFLEPSFVVEDVNNTRDRLVALFQQEKQNPEKYVNTLVNQVFYEPGHPYRFMPSEVVEQLRKFTPGDLKGYHKSILNTNGLQIVYVGPKLSSNMRAKIEANFASMLFIEQKRLDVHSPKFDPKKRYVFEHREIPTAYIRAKFNAPGASNPDAAASRVLFEILGEELHEQVRTKRSLSYAVSATTLQLDQGIGVLSASTSKPRETIEVITQVLRTIRDVPYTEEKLTEYKNVFTTSFYLTIETHDSLAGALADSQFYQGNAAALYDLPAKISKVTAADVQRLAKDLVKRMRVAVIYDKEKFLPEWINPLLSL